MTTGYERGFYRDIGNIADRLDRISFALERLAESLDAINARQHKAADENNRFINRKE